ncbi:hypothetical protein BaRGS_00030378, partial [Batillaria attramentaria]
GGSGFIGRHVTKLLKENGMKVLWASRAAGPNKITWSDLQRRGLPEGVTAVVSMSGENILNPMKRWNDSFKEAVRASRVDCTRYLADAICQAKVPPKVFISFSGVGFYKPDPSIEYDESSPGGNFDFLSKLCTDWEAAAKLPSDLGVRQVILRCGVVLGRDGGMIQQLYWPFFLGLGGPIGSGKQWLPWIHVADVAGLVTHAILNDHVSGILNAVAPEPVTNAQFAKTFASAMWRPAVIPMPGFIMNTVYGPERGIVVLEGQKVIPKRTLETGYPFAFPTLASACKDVSQMLTINSVSGS